MGIEITSWHEDGPAWQNVGSKFNPATMGTDPIVLDEQKRDGQRTRKAAAALITVAGRVLALNKGTVYEVTLIIGGQRSTVKIDAKRRMAVLTLRPDTRISSIVTSGGNEVPLERVPGADESESDAADEAEADDTTPEPDADDTDDDSASGDEEE